VQSATTKTQQQAATAESLSRKITEARLAVELDKRFSKDEILNRYLNTVYYGHGAYGVEAAAQTYFSTSAAKLTLDQAATLAGLVQNPTADDPITHPQAAVTRRNQVLDRMHQLGHLSSADLAAAKSAPIGTQPGPVPPDGCAQATVGGFFCAYLEDYLTSSLGLSEAQLHNGGLTIQTTLRPDMQKAGDAAVVHTLSQNDSRAGIYTVVQPGTGHVLAISVNRRFGCTGTGCTSVDLGLAAGQGSGSTYKVFTAAYALQHGFNMSFTQTTSDPYVSHVYKQGRGPYTVSNAGKYPPTLDMADALVMSSNTWFVSMEDQLGSITGPVQTAQRMGLFSLSDAEAQKIIAEKRGSFTLGTEATSPLALASAYSTVYAGGKACRPTPVTGVLDSAGQPLTGKNGKPLDLGDHCTPDALPAPVANTLAQVMRGDVQSPIGTATRANIPGHDISGKTGTSQDNYSVAFVGSTPEFTGAVMVYNPDHNQNVGGFGGDKGAQIWHDAMAPIFAHQPTAPIPPADPVLLGQQPGACHFTESTFVLNC
jgi:membrane peptidoglycan carboxypeptidase